MLAVGEVAFMKEYCESAITTFFATLLITSDSHVIESFATPC